MNESETNSPEGESPASTSAPQPEAKETAKSNRLWLFVLLVIIGLIAWEGLALYGYHSSSTSMAAAVQDRRESGEELTLKAAEDMLVGFPRRSSDELELNKTVTYRWRGLLDEYGGVRFTMTPGAESVAYFEQGIPTADEEAQMLREYPPLEGDTTTGAAGGGTPMATPISTPPANEPDESQAPEAGTPGEDSKD